jgi:hypothetical protein
MRGFRISDIYATPSFFSFLEQVSKVISRPVFPADLGTALLLASPSQSHIQAIEVAVLMMSNHHETNYSVG